MVEAEVEGRVRAGASLARCLCRQVGDGDGGGHHPAGERLVGGGVLQDGIAAARFAGHEEHDVGEQGAFGGPQAHDEDVVADADDQIFIDDEESGQADGVLVESLVLGEPPVDRAGVLQPDEPDRVLEVGPGCRGKADFGALQQVVSHRMPFAEQVVQGKEQPQARR